ncbi:hypothetical protein [Rhodococcoides yunnanense]|uniref:hypothetical protein n=1 Tax=Rhodococcoides yunnanense TaxID=278209 RepID=UPI00093443A2|nr:hypothetical protein [Rhodococcus yunnanensis]
MTSAVCHLVVGPRKHGVVEYAISVHDALVHGALAHGGRVDFGTDHRCAFLESPDAELPPLDCSLVHIHVTDRLFGRTPGEATERFSALVDALGTDVSVTLHDLPQPSDGAAMQARAEFYRTVVRVAAGVIVSSEHETALLQNVVDDSIVPAMVPLMIGTRPPRRRLSTPTAPTVGVLGFLYPGKGHIETLRAMEDLPISVGFVALGTPSPGHEYLADELRGVAARTGRRIEITGFLGDEELERRIHEVTVPVAYHRHLSASGSINTWIAQGRKPLVPRGGYITELDDRSPGVVSIHADDDGSLRHAIASAIDDSTSTWIDTSVEPVPSPSDVAAAYDEHLTRWTR